MISSATLYGASEILTYRANIIIILPNMMMLKVLPVSMHLKKCTSSVCSHLSFQGWPSFVFIFAVTSNRTWLA